MRHYSDGIRSVTVLSLLKSTFNAPFRFSMSIPLLDQSFDCHRLSSRIPREFLDSKQK